MSGKPTEKDLISVLEEITAFPFPKSPFTVPLFGVKEYSEAELRSVIKVMSEKIQNYLIRHSDAHNFISLVKSKVKDEDWEEYSKGNLYKELIDAKTFKRCFPNPNKKEEAIYASAATFNILKAFQIVWREEKEKQSQLQQVSGVYLVFTTHNTRHEKFQKSIISLDRLGKATLKFKDGDNNVKRIEAQGEIIGSNNLLLTFKEANFALIFYAYIGGVLKPDFIQAVICYSNRMGNTIANISVWERINMAEEEQEDFLDSFIPERELKDINRKEELLLKFNPNVTVRKNIQYFLLHKTGPIAALLYSKTLPFDFSKSLAILPGPYKQEASFYEKATELKGRYFIYFNERFHSRKSEDEIFEKNDFFSTIGRGLVDIKVDDRTGILTAIMRTRKNTKGEVLTHKGVIENHTLSNNSYLIISTYLEPEKDRYLNMFFNIVDDEKLIGSFNISYSPTAKLGSGTVIMVKASVILNREESEVEDLWESIKPEAFLPHLDAPENPLEERIVNFLSRDDLSLVRPPDYQQLNRFKDSIYAGLYKMYSHTNNGNLKISLLKIYKNGYARHLDPYNGDQAYGQVEKIDNVLNITLRNESSRRTGFCCIKVDRITPKKDFTFYGGTYAGVSRSGDEIPIASKFILEFIGKDAVFEDFENELEPIQKDSALMEGVMEQIQEKLEKLETSEENAQSTPVNNSRITFSRNIFNEKDLSKQ